MKKSTVITICSICSVLAAAGITLTAIAFKKKGIERKESESTDDDFTTEIPDTEKPIRRVGGFDYSKPLGAGLTDEEQKIFDTAMDGICGVGYQPICLLGTQVVAGVNYAFLCRATPVYPESEHYIAIVTVFRDLKGNITLSKVQHLESCVSDEETLVETSTVQDRMTVSYDGGWTLNEGAIFADNGMPNRALGKATEYEDAFRYDEIAYLGSQVVAGRNYAFVLLETPLREKSAPKLVFAKIYEDLEGGARILTKQLIRLGQ